MVELYNATGIEGLAPWYTGFWRHAVVEARLDVLTLNYDTLIERVLADLAGPENVSDGFGTISEPFSPFEPARFWNPEVHTVSHLHGCTHFGYESGPDSTERGPFIHTALAKFPSFQAASNTWFGRSDEQSMDGTMPVGLPLISGARKPDQLANHVYGDYWAKLVRAISLNDRLLVVGYSGLDDHLNAQLKLFRKYHPEGKALVLEYSQVGIDTVNESYLQYGILQEVSGDSPKKHEVWSSLLNLVPMMGPQEGRQKIADHEYLRGPHGRLFVTGFEQAAQHSQVLWQWLAS